MSTTFADVLAFRGRILLFTASAAIAEPFEMLAIAKNAELVSTRGVADKFVPVARWQAIHGDREFAVFSTDQRSYVTGVRLPCTDIVWVSNAVMHDGQMWERMTHAMQRGDPDNPPRRWLMRPDGSGLVFPGEQALPVKDAPNRDDDL